jgi:NADPH2:quinone reductase
MTFTACRVFKENNTIQHRIVEQDDYQLESGQVLIKIDYSGINFKDALGATGTAPIYKTFPINAGIDCAGVVADSRDEAFQPGDSVLVNGCGLGEVQDGGLAQQVAVPGAWVMPMPSPLTSRSAMIYGTAGFTAALALDRMLHNGQSPDMGPVVVTGASGGVGSFAITMLDKLGYQSIAVTGREEHYDYLKRLGADEVMSVADLALGNQPLEKARFGGAIDNVGGELLSQLIPHINLWGNVASIGMAGGPNISGTVFPYILRGVSLLGASSTNCPMPRRLKIWQWIADELLSDKLDEIVSEDIRLAEVSDYFQRLLKRQHRGRIIVNCS